MQIKIDINLPQEATTRAAVLSAMCELTNAIALAIECESARLPAKPTPPLPVAATNDVPAKIQVVLSAPNSAAEEYTDRLWYSERNEVLRAHYPAGVPLAQIARMLNALPGRQVDHNRVAIQANKLGLYRPDPAVLPKLSKAEVMARVAVVPRPEPRLVNGSLPADLDTIRIWASQRGILIRDWEDLPKVNDKRESLGLPRFSRLFPNKGVRG